MSNYEAYKPSSGAMGDRLTAMKAAFQVGSVTCIPNSTSREKEITWKNFTTDGSKCFFISSLKSAETLLTSGKLSLVVAAMSHPTGALSVAVQSGRIACRLH